MKHGFFVLQKMLAFGEGKAFAHFFVYCTSVNAVAF